MELKVVYVGGVNRSGSTLLTYLLANLAGVAPGGELQGIWRGGLIDDELCGCGERFSRCQFWVQVGNEAFGGWANVDGERIARLADRVTARTAIPGLLTGRGSITAEVEEYRDALGSVYRGIAATSGASVVVDATKSPAGSLVAAGVRDVDFRLVHLIRDSRGVAYSLSKAKRDPGKSGDRQQMPVRRPARTSLRWVYNSLAFELIGSLGRGCETITYEALVAEPDAAIERLARELQIASRDHDSSPPTLQRQHTIRGNPAKFEAGVRPIVADRQWETQLGRFDRLLVTAVSSPMLLRYGYLGHNTAPSSVNGRQSGLDPL